MKITTIIPVLLLPILASGAVAQSNNFNIIKTSADKGGADAQNSLGVIYATGDGIPHLS